MLSRTTGSTTSVVLQPCALQFTPRCHFGSQVGKGIEPCWAQRALDAPDVSLLNFCWWMWKLLIFVHMKLTVTPIDPWRLWTRVQDAVAEALAKSGEGSNSSKSIRFLGLFCISDSPALPLSSEFKNVMELAKSIHGTNLTPRMLQLKTLST